MKSILVSNLNNLGDVICSTAALDLIRRGFPDAHIGLLIKSDAAGAMYDHPFVDTLYVYRYRSGSSLRSIWRMSREIRAQRYECFLSLDRKPRSALIALLAGIKTRITPDRLHLATDPRWWMPLLCNRILHFEKKSLRSLVDMFEEPVRKGLGLEGKGQTCLPPIAPADSRFASELLAEAGNTYTVGLSVRANSAMKNWPAERFAELMDRLSQSHSPFFYITGAPCDHGYIDELLKLCRVAKGKNLAGQVTLMQTAALASQSDLFITLDTGTVHVVGNSGLRNLICLFTSTIPEGVLESARQAKVFWSNEPCCPCSSCPHDYGAAPCQTGIAVDKVYEEAVRLLDALE